MDGGEVEGLQWLWEEDAGSLKGVPTVKQGKRDKSNQYMYLKIEKILSIKTGKSNLWVHQPKFAASLHDRVIRKQIVWVFSTCDREDNSESKHLIHVVL